MNNYEVNKQINAKIGAETNLSTTYECVKAQVEKLGGDLDKVYDIYSGELQVLEHIGGGSEDNATLNFTGIVNEPFTYFVEKINIASKSPRTAKFSSTFSNLKNVKEIIAPNMATAVATQCYNTFSQCAKLEAIDISNWVTTRLVDFRSMFNGDTKLTNINFGNNWNTGLINIFRSNFSGCSSLVSLDLKGFNFTTSTADGNFKECKNLKTIIGDTTIPNDAITADITAFNGLIVSNDTKVVAFYLSFADSPNLRYSSMLATANGIAAAVANSGAGVTFNTTAWANMNNDDDTIPSADVILARQNKIKEILASKNYVCRIVDKYDPYE